MKKLAMRTNDEKFVYRIVGDDYPNEEKPLGDLIKEVMAEGGYLTGWKEFPHFKPKDGEIVIIHRIFWKDTYGEPAIYMKNQKLFQLASFQGACEEQCVDYWMPIPPIPKRED